MHAERMEEMRAWVEVDLGALHRNAARVAEAVHPARLLVMVKADGYGLGAVEVAQALVSLEPYALGVATVGEAIALRERGLGGRIIVFAPCAALDAPALGRHGLEAAVLGPDGLERLSAAGVPLHVEIDTGMGRAGLASDRVDQWGPRLAELIAGGVRLETVFTHFHSAGHDADATRGQAARFEAAVEVLAAAGVPSPLRHAANSDAIRGEGQYHLDLVRPGLYLYGGGRGRGLSTRLPDPEPVARVRARVLEVRDLAPGSSVSYGATYVTTRVERIATVGIGYADGLPQGISNRGHGLIRGERVPIRGQVCMDMITVDVSNVSCVEPGDVVTLLGKDDDDEITLRDLAKLGETIEYGVLTGLGRRLVRVYSDSNAG